MKKTLVAIVVLFSLGFLAGCNFDTAVEHNDKVIKIVNESTKSYDNYAEKSNKSNNIEELKAAYTQALADQKKCLENLKQVKPFNIDNTELIDAGKEYIETQLSLLENEEKQLIDLWESDGINGDTAIKEYKKKQDELFAKITEKSDLATATFNKKQEKFAKERGYEVEKKEQTK